MLNHRMLNPLLIVSMTKDLLRENVPMEFRNSQFKMLPEMGKQLVKIGLQFIMNSYY